VTKVMPVRAADKRPKGSRKRPNDVPTPLEPDRSPPRAADGINLSLAKRG